ncbi:hypothetical protein J6U78_02410 [bacterium]|nr:hypothetical protein [bacterium]MBP5435133.1 hypothetical protein [bacterium]
MKDIEVSWVELAGPKAKDPDQLMLLGGTYGGRAWSMRPEAMAMAIDRGLYAFHAVCFEEVLPVVLVRNTAGKVCGIGTPKDVGPLKLLLTLPGKPDGKGEGSTVTVTKTRTVNKNLKKSVATKKNAK